MDPSEFVEQACAALGVDLERLASPRRDRATVGARLAILLLAVERYGIRTRDLGRILGRSGDRVSHWTGRASRRKASDADFRHELDILDAQLAAELGVRSRQKGRGAR